MVKCTVVQPLRICTGRMTHRGVEVYVKVKCTVVQALRFCTGRTAHRWGLYRYSCTLT